MDGYGGRSKYYLMDKALKHGATEIGLSRVKGKRLFVVYQGKRINFGLKGGSTFFDHGDEKKRQAWLARHTKIRLKDGRLAHKVKTQASFWSKAILWD